jgi:hypothetical protein
MIIDSPVISGSLAASFRNVAITGSLGVTGSIITTGTITAQTLVVQTVTSSVIYSSGSNVFGNNIANTQVMTGSVTVTGSLAVVTNGTEFQVNATGVKIGNIIGDTHTVTGSLLVSGSVGIGTTPSAWVSPFTAIQGGTYGQHIAFQSNAADIKIGSNNYYNGANYLYYTSSQGAAQFNVGSTNGFIFNIAPTGTTGATVNFTSSMVITNAGNVGIGLIAPVSRLSLGRASYISTSIPSLLVYDGGYIANGGNGYFAGFTIDQPNGGDFNMIATYEGAIVFSKYTSSSNTTALTERMRITSGGLVGIGTSTPVAPLHIYSANQNVASSLATSYSNSKFRLEPFNTSGIGISMGLISPNVNYLQGIYSDGSTTAPFTMQPYGGNVGIGTSSPANILDVVGTSRFTSTATTYNGTVQSVLISAAANAAFTINGGIGSFAYQTFAQNQVAQFEIGIDASTSKFYISNVPQTGNVNANISVNKSDGNVGVGTLSPNARLEVFKTTATMTNDPGNSQFRVSASSIKFVSIGYDPTANVGYIQGTEAAVAWRPLHLNNNGAAVYAGSVRLDTLSDERIKDNIQPITNALNKVLSITGKKFHLKDEPENKIRYGFIAQDLEGILDEFVIQTDMTFKKDDLIVENVKSIENWASSWAALLVEAVKELKSQNDSLQSQIDELKNK